MIYSVTINISVPYKTEKIEAENEAEAQKIADVLKKARLAAVVLADNELIKANSYISIADENYKYVVGGYYLIKRYHRFHLAKCTKSGRAYGYRRRGGFEHVFRFMESGRTVILTGPKPHTKAIHLCDTGDITKETNCDQCEKRYWCYTTRNEVKAEVKT